MFRNFRSDLVIENLGDEFLVLSPNTGESFRLSSDFTGVVKKLVAGDDVSGFSLQVATLDELGLLEGQGTVKPSRRRAIAGLAGVIGAGAMTLALPTAALASSSSLFISNTTFEWVDGAQGTGGFTVLSVVGLDRNLFPLDSLWTLTVTLGADTRTANASVQDVSDPDFDFDLEFSFLGNPRPTAGSAAVLIGRLSGPGGLTSNDFQISELSPP